LRSEHMGLDIVEFIMSVEEKFNIEMPDREVEKLTTPRKLVDYIVTKVKASADGKCITQREFYRLRRALVARHWATKENLIPETPLDQIVPRPNRRTMWQQLGEEMQAPHWPGLVRPPSIKASLLAVAGVAFALPWIFRGEDLFQGHYIPILLCVVSTTVVLWVGVATTRPLRTAFPPTYVCVGDIARHLVTIKHQPQKAEEGWSREQVRETVRALIIEQFGVTDFSDDSHFVDDICID
jgi:acyl carrier protein